MTESPPKYQDNVFRFSQNAIVAIAIRDVMERYGRSNIGFLWAFVEPMMLAVGVMVVWSLMKSGYEHGVSVMTMVFTGYLPLTLWRHITGGAPTLYTSGFSLLYHRRISMLDILLARVTAEFAATTASTLLVFLALRLFGLIQPIERPDLVIFGWVLMLWLAIGGLAFFSCLTTLIRPLAKFYNAFQYLLLPVSGALFMLEWLSPSAREALSYNPMVHCYEMIREGAFGSRVDTFFTPWYVILWGVFLFVMSLLMLRAVREELSGH